MPKPITNLDDFCKALRKTVKRFPCALHASPLSDRMGGRPKHVRRYGGIYWSREGGSLWGPIEIVCIRFFLVGKEPWLPTYMAAHRIGLDDELCHDIYNASLGRRDMRKSVRKRLLEATNLWEL